MNRRKGRIKHVYRTTLHDMTLTKHSLISFKTPVLGLVLMVAYSSVSPRPFKCHYQHHLLCRKAVLGPCLFWGFTAISLIFTGRPLSTIKTSASRLFAVIGLQVYREVDGA